ncbi:hypothetical protein BDY24DRAFT_411202 [Mrakia frigida]|uniref:uncharacterized protein n=1 Tax=Mrakia frigida TaxID=29902 RepID=UPI003FCC0C72
MSTTLTSEQVSSLGALAVYDEQGGKVKVRSLFEGEAKTTVTIFLRHFYCAFDKNYYLASLASSLSPDSNVNIIGCGSWEPIKFYREETHSPYQILQMLPNLPLAKMLFTNQIPLPKYLQEDGAMRLVAKSGRSVWEHLGLVWKGGVYEGWLGASQNEGEIVFERDDGDDASGGGIKASFVHLMKHPADHTEAEELKKIAGLRGIEAT